MGLRGSWGRMAEQGVWGLEPGPPTRVSGRCLVTVLFWKGAAQGQLAGA